MKLKTVFESSSWKANDPQSERNFRETCARYESQGQDYQEYANLYRQSTSLYITQDWWGFGEMRDAKYLQALTNKTKLIIYDTENEKEEVKILEPPAQLGIWTCITKLPNCELFCYGNGSGIALIIDKNYKIRILPPGKPCSNPSCIYFDNNVYCFGGSGNNYYDPDFSNKFDLNENRWINLTPKPKSQSQITSTIFNRNILIAGYSDTLYLYSIDTDSFSRISCNLIDLCNKILTKADKLYLFQDVGNFYESEDEYSWKKIGKTYDLWIFCQMHCSYNKNAIYISSSAKPKYYIFDLTKKNFILPS